MEEVRDSLKCCENCGVAVNRNLKCSNANCELVGPAKGVMACKTCEHPCALCDNKCNWVDPDYSQSLPTEKGGSE